MFRADRNQHQAALKAQAAAFTEQMSAAMAEGEDEVLIAAVVGNVVEAIEKAELG